MAVMRRILLGLTVAGAMVWRSAAQPAPEREGLRRLFSAAMLQDRMARLVAEREVRPEAKALSTEMAAWRTGQIESLRAILQARHVEEPALIREHEAAWEGIEPLNYLALSRRYAEVQVALLEWEVATYETAAQTGDAALIAYADGLLPDLRRLLESARRTKRAVLP